RKQTQEASAATATAETPAPSFVSRYKRHIAIGGGVAVAIAVILMLYSRGPTSVTLAPTPAELAFSYQAGAAAPARLEVRFDNPQRSYTMRVSDAWIGVTPQGGDGLSVLSVAVTPQFLAPGPHEGWIEVTGKLKSGIEGTVRIPVRLMINEPGTTSTVT